MLYTIMYTQFPEHRMHNDCVITQDHLILGNVLNFPYQTKYEPQCSGIYSTGANVHAGQRKLLISEIEFLTRVHIQRAIENPDIKADAPFLCVYAGACPCTHLHVLMSMFPNVAFILVDPAFSKSKHVDEIRKFDKNRVVIWEENFGEHIIDVIHAWIGVRNFKDGTAQFESIPATYFPYFKDLYGLPLVDWESREDILFISDIRLDARDEAAIESDMDLQALCFHKLRAINGLLKFRLPYVTEEWASNWRQNQFKRVYLEGEVHMPIWGPRSTTECRLFVQRNCGVSVYDPILHECQLAGFNKQDRQMPYSYRNHQFESFDSAATELIKSNYRTYVNTFIPSKNRSRYTRGLNNCKSIEKM
jgi:cap2 methyltransferase